MERLPRQTTRWAIMQVLINLKGIKLKSVFSHQNRIKLKISYKKISGKKDPKYLETKYSISKQSMNQRRNQKDIRKYFELN